MPHSLFLFKSNNTGGGLTQQQVLCLIAQSMNWEVDQFEGADPPATASPPFIFTLSSTPNDPNEVMGFINDEPYIGNDPATGNPYWTITGTQVEWNFYPSPTSTYGFYITDTDQITFRYLPQVTPGPC